MNRKKEIKPFGIRDKIGYMFGDFANDFTFLLSSMFMMKFYTDVMGISPGIVGGLMMAARCVDAVTDITMGQIADRSKPTADGKFKPWLKRMCGPVAVSSFLIYQSAFANMAYGFKVVWMVITYILWGSVFYTSINIPYGSMASAISEEPNERVSLSTWRTIGSTFAGLVIGVSTPMIAYVVVDGNTVLSGTRMTVIAGIFSVCAVICYLLCFHLVTERVVIEKQSERIKIGKLVRSLFTNRSLIGIILAAIMVLLAQLGIQGMAGYVYPNYYGSGNAQALSMLIGTVGMLIICAPLATRLSIRFGKKELSIVSCLIGAVSYLICFLIRPESPYVYIVFYAIAFIGQGFFSMVIWAMITDVIDDAELRNGVREDGTIYSVYSFARKAGQAISNGLSGLLLEMIGYSQVTAFDTEVVNGIFNISCIVPVIGLVLVAASLYFVYPLDKKRVEENNRKLSQLHEDQPQVP